MRAGDWVRPCPALDWLQPLDTAPPLHALLDRWRSLRGEALAGSLWQYLWRQGLIVSAS